MKMWKSLAVSIAVAVPLLVIATLLQELFGIPRWLIPLHNFILLNLSITPLLLFLLGKKEKQNHVPSQMKLVSAVSASSNYSFVFVRV